MECVVSFSSLVKCFEFAYFVISNDVVLALPSLVYRNSRYYQFAADKHYLWRFGPFIWPRDTIHGCFKIFSAVRRFFGLTTSSLRIRSIALILVYASSLKLQTNLSDMLSQ